MAAVRGTADGNMEESQKSFHNARTAPLPVRKKVFDVLFYVPPRLRYNPSKPLRYSGSLNLLFGLAAMVTVANLYYTHPILNILAADFGVSNEKSSNIPTLAQAGYATGLLFVCPLGDLVKRRPFTLGLMLLTATLWIGLCITNNFNVFLALTYLTSLTTVTPQIMLPLVADLAPPERRATAVSIVTSGLLLGLLFARVMSGVVANFISWRYIYWIALGLQYFFLVVLWFTMPDYAQTNKGLNYFSILWSIVTITINSPVLVQSCLIGLCTSTTFTSFWTTLTFLLSSPPYNYSPVIIGLFALIGFGTMSIGPPFSRYVIDKVTPLITVIFGEVLCIIGISIGTFTGTFTVAGPIVMAVFLDAGLQISQISNRAAIYAIAPKARNRVNTAFMTSVFCGQLIGTAVGNHLYAQGGWRLSGSISIAFIGAALVLCFVRGPWEDRWVGWRGGWSIRRRDLPAMPKQDERKSEEIRLPEIENEGPPGTEGELKMVVETGQPSLK